MNKRDTRRQGLLNLFATVAICSTASFALAECREPSFDLTIPDGKTASTEEMVKAQQAVKAIVDEGEAYVSCIKENDGRSRANRLINNVLDKMQVLAAQFNRQLRYHRRAN